MPFSMCGGHCSGSRLFVLHDLLRGSVQHHTVRVLYTLSRRPVQRSQGHHLHQYQCWYVPHSLELV